MIYLNSKSFLFVLTLCQYWYICNFHCHNFQKLFFSFPCRDTREAEEISLEVCINVFTVDRMIFFFPKVVVRNTRIKIT